MLFQLVFSAITLFIRGSFTEVVFTLYRKSMPSDTSISTVYSSANHHANVHFIRYRLQLCNVSLLFHIIPKVQSWIEV